MTSPRHTLWRFTSWLALTWLFVSCGAPASNSATLTNITDNAPAATTQTSIAVSDQAEASASSIAALADLDVLSDEFNDASRLAEWKDQATVEGWPSMIETVDTNTSSAGHLYLVPTTSGWFEDFRGVLLYKDVTGDFDVTTRILATGKNGELPQRTYSLTGLMARTPRTVTMDTWQSKQENWVFITTGYGDNRPGLAGSAQIETKTTVNSISNLVLKAIPSGWVELRVVRVGSHFVMMYRVADKAWTISKRYNRKDMPETLQVGLNAYTNWESFTSDAATFNREMEANPRFQPDLVVRSDYVRFRRPQLSDADRNSIASGKVSSVDLIKLLGD